MQITDFIFIIAVVCPPGTMLGPRYPNLLGPLAEVLHQLTGGS